MKNINTSGRHLQQIINDILDLSKIEAGKMDLHVASYPVSYFEEAVQRVLAGGRSRRRRSTLRFDLAPEIEELVVDQTRFKQILINLVSNAVKFSRTAGRRDRPVGACGQRHRVHRRGRTGIGIKPEEISEALPPVPAGGERQVQNREGIGLGLAITKKSGRAARRHDLRGERVGQGDNGSRSASRWWWTPRASRSCRRGCCSTRCGGRTRAQKAASGRWRSWSRIPRRQPNCSSCYIESAGYRVEIARNGADALEMAKRLHPTSSRWTCCFPVKDGWQVLKELKQHPLCKHIPVIIVSIVDEKNLGFSLGAVDYFVKPVNREELVQALEQVHLLPATGDAETDGSGHRR